MDRPAERLRNLGVRTRVGLWLLLVAAIIVAAGLVLMSLTQNRLESSSEDSLRQLLELEQSRIVAELDDERADVENVANSPNLIAIFDAAPLIQQNALNLLLATAQRNGRDFVALSLINRDGSMASETPLAMWNATQLTTQAMERRSTIVGPARETGTLGIVTPVVTEQGEVLGALVVEIELDNIVWLSRRYESFTDTSELLVYQRLRSGECMLLTNLRFDRSAAFSTLDGDFAARCGDLSSDKMLDATDYRGVQTRSAWTNVPGTDWGIAIKMDDADVFGLLNNIRLTILLSGLYAGSVLVGGWFVLVRSIGTRLSRAARAAEELSSGNFTALIDDQRADEIGRMSQSMDGLARDLAADIERRERAEGRLRVQANTDDLTGIMNRRRMTARLRELSDEGRDFAIIFLDLDGFKEINDTYGHSVGDEVLKAVTNRLQAAVSRSGEHVNEIARWGGDEFVVLCPDCLEPHLHDFIDKIDSNFDDAIRTTVGQHRIGISIGSADSSKGATVEEVLSLADASMYRMKRRGQVLKRVFPKSIKFAESALEEDRVLAFLQPFVSIDADNGVHLSGAEALVRVRKHDDTLALPDSFLPGLGTSEQALALDLRVLDRATATAARLLNKGLVPPDFYVSVNCGATAMADVRLPDKIEAILKENALPARNLVVEIPETAEHVDTAIVIRLRRMGVRIAIDDVGCQFSNLGRLVDIPSDIAKIDRRWLPDNETELDLITGLVEQCRIFDPAAIVVEGIENRAQLDLIRDIGIDHIQGFFFGRPVDAASFEALWGKHGSDSFRFNVEDEKSRAVAAVDLQDFPTGTASL